MQYADLKAQRKHHIAWRLLASPHAPLIGHFFYHTFIQPNQRALPFDKVESQLEDTLYQINERYGAKTFPKKASQYLEDWAGGSNAFLRKYYEKGHDMPQLDLTPGAEKAIEWLQSLQPRQFVGTESRLLTLYRLLQDISKNTEKDVDVRIATLEKEKQQIEDKIARLKSGLIEEFDDTKVKERWFEAEDTARQLLSDFRQVEYNFRTLDQKVREMITQSEKSKGELLDDIFHQQNYIHDSEQGKSFAAFWHFLMSPNRQEELEQLTLKALKHPALADIENSPFLRDIGYALLDAGQKVYQTNSQLIEQLRKYLADQAWLENKRILKLIRQIERSALQLKSQKLPRDFFALDQSKMDLHLVMEQKLYAPKRQIKLRKTQIKSAKPKIDLTVLYQQQWIDEAQLQQNIRRLLQTREQISLKEVLIEYPLEQGLAELIAYLNLATQRQHTLIDTEQQAQLKLSAESQRIVTLPKIIFSR